MGTGRESLRQRWRIELCRRGNPLEEILPFRRLSFSLRLLEGDGERDGERENEEFHGIGIPKLLIFYVIKELDRISTVKSTKSSPLPLPDAGNLRAKKQQPHVDS